MKLYRLLIIAALAVPFFSACEKYVPFDDLGSGSGNFRAEIRTSVNTSKPELGDTVLVTSSVWQRNDQLAKVEFLHTLIEKFGIYMELNSTKLQTWDDENPVMVVTDTIFNNVAWQTFEKNVLDNYYVTLTNNYVFRGEYDLFVPSEGKFSFEGDALINQLPVEAYEILKSQLAVHISVADYETFFPGSPASHFTMSGTVKTGISATGKAYLRENLTKALLISTGYKVFRKNGSLSGSIRVRATTDAGAMSETNTILEQKTY